MPSGDDSDPVQNVGEAERGDRLQRVGERPEPVGRFRQRLRRRAAQQSDVFSPEDFEVVGRNTDDDPNPERFVAQVSEQARTEQRQQAKQSLLSKAAKQSERFSKDDFKIKTTTNDQGETVFEAVVTDAARQRERSERRQQVRKQAAKGSEEFSSSDFEVEKTTNDQGETVFKAELSEAARKRERAERRQSLKEQAAKGLDRFSASDFTVKKTDSDGDGAAEQLAVSVKSSAVQRERSEQRQSLLSKAAKQSDVFSKEDFQVSKVDTDDDGTPDTFEATVKLKALKQAKQQQRKDLLQRAAKQSDVFSKSDFQVSKIDTDDDGTVDKYQASVTDAALKEARQKQRQSLLSQAAKQSDAFSKSDFQVSKVDTDDDGTPDTFQANVKTSALRQQATQSIAKSLGVSASELSVDFGTALSKPVRRFDKDGDLQIDTGELQSAAEAFAAGNLTKSAFKRVKKARSGASISLTEQGKSQLKTGEDGFVSKLESQLAQSEAASQAGVESINLDPEDVSVSVKDGQVQASLTEQGRADVKDQLQAASVVDSEATAPTGESATESASAAESTTQSTPASAEAQLGDDTDFSITSGGQGDRPGASKSQDTAPGDDTTADDPNLGASEQNLAEALGFQPGLTQAVETQSVDAPVDEPIQTDLPTDPQDFSVDSETRRAGIANDPAVTFDDVISAGETLAGMPLAAPTLGAKAAARTSETLGDVATQVKKADPIGNVVSDIRAGGLVDLGGETDFRSVDEDAEQTRQRRAGIGDAVGNLASEVGDTVGTAPLAVTQAAARAPETVKDVRRFQATTTPVKDFAKSVREGGLIDVGGGDGSDETDFRSVDETAEQTRQRRAGVSRVSLTDDIGRRVGGPPLAAARALSSDIPSEDELSAGANQAVADVTGVNLKRTRRAASSLIGGGSKNPTTAAATVGTAVALAEPSPFGEATVLGLGALGVIGADVAGGRDDRRDPVFDEPEVPVSDDGAVREGEFGVPSEDVVTDSEIQPTEGRPTSELPVSDDPVFAGGEVSIQPDEESAPVGTFRTNQLLGRQRERGRERQREEESFLRDRGASDEELEEILQGPDEEVTLGEERTGDDVEAPRQFPTGEEAVVGRPGSQETATDEVQSFDRDFRAVSAGTATPTPRGRGPLPLSDTDEESDTLAGGETLQPPAVQEPSVDTPQTQDTLQPDGVRESPRDTVRPGEAPSVNFEEFSPTIQPDANLRPDARTRTNVESETQTNTAQAQFIQSRAEQANMARGFTPTRVGVQAAAEASALPGLGTATATPASFASTTQPGFGEPTSFSVGFGGGGGSSESPSRLRLPRPDDEDRGDRRGDDGRLESETFPSGIGSVEELFGSADESETTGLFE